MKQALLVIDMQVNRAGGNSVRSGKVVFPLGSCAASALHTRDIWSTAVSCKTGRFLLRRQHCCRRLPLASLLLLLPR